MPAPANNDEFLDLVRKSGVVDEKRLAGHLERLATAGGLPPVTLDFATLLVREGVITRFQAEQFLQGKWKRFTLGKYRVLEKLGAGGMGSVYLCEHMLMRRRVAVKVLPTQKAGDTSSLDRFRREARAVAALDHPNIVRAYDMDEDDGLHFLVMEHVDGASLQEIIKRNPNGIDSLRACHYIRQAALGLQHAHETAGLVHRDIKPGNILVDRNGIVKVLDMGLARFFHDDEDQLTKKHDENVLGTADYLAPEQALDSHTVDIRADIYSLGGTFYYCLTGKTPFTEGSVAHKLIWHQTRTPKAVRSIRPDVPEAVATILDKMMAKHPDQRYQTPQQVADALAPLTQTPIQPPPDLEMPQLSLAATRALNPGSEASGQGQRTNEGGSRKNWTVGSNPAPPSPPPVVRQLPPPPSPRPMPAMAPTVALAPQMELPEPPKRMLPEPVAIAAHPTPLPAAATETTPTMEEEPDWVPPVEPMRSVAGRATRRKPEEPVSKKGLYIGVGIGGVLVVAAVSIGIYLLISPPPTVKKPSPPREPLRVTVATSGGLTQVLRNARDGDRIILEVDITEASVSVAGKKNLTIEGAEGKVITWRAPAGLDNESKLLTISGEPTGLTLKNINFDGQGRGMALVQFYGLCEGLKMDNVEMRGLRQYGLLLVNTAGTSERPMVLQNVRVMTTAPTQTGARFMNVGKHITIRENAHIIFRDCRFEGPGKKMTMQKAGDVSRTVETAGESVETVP